MAKMAGSLVKSYGENENKLCIEKNNKKFFWVFEINLALEDLNTNN